MSAALKWLMSCQKMVQTQTTVWPTCLKACMIKYIEKGFFEIILGFVVSCCSNNLHLSAEKQSMGREIDWPHSVVAWQKVTK